MDIGDTVKIKVGVAAGLEGVVTNVWYDMLAATAWNEHPASEPHWIEVEVLLPVKPDGLVQHPERFHAEYNINQLEVIS